MEDNIKELFWEAKVDDIEKGYVEHINEFICLVCEKPFEKGRIYEVDGVLYDAEGAVKKHIEKEHGGMAAYLLNLNSTFTGISEVQRNFLMHIKSGMSDKEAAKEMGVAQSTIRNHRYKLREKEKQARVFLALMKLIYGDSDNKISKMDKEQLCDPHKSATTVDDRFNITDKDIRDTLRGYMDKNGALKDYPVKEKKKIIVLREIAKGIVKDRLYTEKELNTYLKRIYEDYVTIRRALVEYGFLERTDDCSKYWVKE